MKKSLFLLFYIPFIGIGQQTYIPDDNFEQALINLGYDNILDDYVLTDNINTIQYLQLGGQNINDMTGIEDFIALKWLDCDQNQISYLDVSNNIALEHLGCGCSCSGGNLLTSLDVSQNVNLKWLQCQVNDLTSLDVSNNFLLEYLDIGWNPITTIDLSHNPLLQHFGLYNAGIGTLNSIDITNNPDLEYLNIGQNQINEIDLTNNNKIKYLSTSGNILQSLDVTNLHNLEVLLCGTYNGSGQITSLDLTNNLLLNRLHCEGNQISGVLDLSNNSLITWLTCENNQITHLDVSNLPYLTQMDCKNNSLIELNVANGNNMNFINGYPANPSLSPALDVRNNQNLHCINVDNQTYSINNWIDIDGFYIDPQHYYGDDCLGTISLINEGKVNEGRKLLKIIDVLGRRTKEIRNKAFFYIYDDGTVEKRIIIE